MLTDVNVAALHINRTHITRCKTLVIFTGTVDKNRTLRKINILPVTIKHMHVNSHIQAGQDYVLSSTTHLIPIFKALLTISMILDDLLLLIFLPIHHLLSDISPPVQNMLYSSK